MAKTFSKQTVDGVEYFVYDKQAREDIATEASAREAAVSAEASAREAADAEMDNVLSGLIDIVDATVVNLDSISNSHNGYYLNTSGNPAQTSGYYTYTDPIAVTKGQTYILSSVGTPNISAVVSCDQSGNNRTSVYVYNDTDDIEMFTYTPDDDGYIMVSFNYNQSHTLFYGESIDSRIDEISDELSDVTEDRENIANMKSIQIGKNWQNYDASTRAIVNVVAKPNTRYFVYAPADTSGGIINVSIIEKTNQLSAQAITSQTIANDSSVSFTTSDSTGIITVQFNGRRDLTSSDFIGYVLYVAKGKYDKTAIDGVARDEIEEISERKPNLVDMSDIQIGKNWMNNDADNRAIIDIDVRPNTEYYLYAPVDGSGAIIDLIAVEKTNPLSAASLATHQCNNDSHISFVTTGSTKTLTVQFNGRETLESSDFSGYVLFVSYGTEELTAVDLIARGPINWIGKRLVWLGTSIPAAGRYDIDNPDSYPIIVGELLNCTVYNEAVGSSALHCKRPDLISTANPYGFMPNFEAASRCITNSLTEMNWIIDHFDDTDVFTQNVPSSLSDADKEFIRSCSWEIKLQKYFTANDFPDAWIIDHGHNDIPSAESEATYTEKTAMTGTQNSGYYSAGQYVESDASSYIEYDVTDELYVWISGTIGAWYDVYDLYDANGNNVGYKRVAEQTDISDLRVPVANVKKIRVSVENTQISTVQVKKLKYPMYNSLYSYNGGLDFIVNKIKSYSPKARIIMIGEYENQKYPTISENQQIASERWEFPLYKQWENTGWSQQYIYTGGEWKTYLDVFIPDGLHPHTDTTGFALKFLASNIASWLNTIR